MRKHFELERVAPEVRALLDDPKIQQLVDEGYAEALGPTSVVNDYIKGRIENEVAYRQRRRSLVPSDELARLAAVAFTGDAAEFAQEVLDDEILLTVEDFFGIPSPMDSDTRTRALKQIRTRLVTMIGSDEGVSEWQDFIRRRVARVAEYGAAESARFEDFRAIAREELSIRQVDFYKGVYDANKVYGASEAVTWDGSLWFANRNTKSKPGTDDSWTLAVKRGRDGRRSASYAHGASA